MFVIGVDSGGSKTRALAVRLDGSFAGYAESGGGNPGHDSRFRENVREAIAGACKDLDIGAVQAVVSGIAGLDSPEDHEWAAECTDVQGLTAERLQVNDAEIAHFGGLEGRPGIVCIQGAGSMVLARTDSGRWVRNYDLMHYANASGRRLGFGVTHAILAGDAQPGEEEIVQAVLTHWGASSVAELRELAASWSTDREEALRVAGRLAPLVTLAAEEGHAMAILACEQAAAEIVVAIRILGPFFEGQDVDVCFSGSCGRSPAVAGRVAESLNAAKEKRYRIVEPRFSPIQGAVFWALQLAGVELTEDTKKTVARASSPA